MTQVPPQVATDHFDPVSLFKWRGIHGLFISFSFFFALLQEDILESKILPEKDMNFNKKHSLKLWDFPLFQVVVGEI